MSTRGRGLIAGGTAALALATVSSAQAQAACAGADTRPTAESLGTAARSTVCLINRERMRRGLHRVRMDRLLQRAATQHALDMANRHYFAHNSLSGATLGARLMATGYASTRRAWAAGEAIAWGTGRQATPRTTLRGWMHSPGHRAILLTGRYRDIGMGIVAAGPSGRKNAATYTADLGCRC